MIEASGQHAIGGLMNEAEIALLRRDVRRLQLACRNQRMLLLVCVAAAISYLAIYSLGHPAPVSAQSVPDKDGIFHVRGLIVEDQSGHERLRLGAPLPDPLIHGVRQKR